MLLKRALLDQIVAGEVDLVFRRWRTPTVKTGGQLRTSVGMLDITAVDRVARSSITATDAHRAGYPSKASLLSELDARTEGDVYRIEVRAAGADPRVALREDADLTADDITELDRRLDRLDRASKEGAWTRDMLRLLATNPHVRAEDLAASRGRDKAPFKNDVRKLKGLGLTISHSPGYELSPRGRAYLAQFDDRGNHDA